MMKQKLIIWGASGHAIVVADIIRLMGNYEIIGFLDDIDARRSNREFCGARVIGGREQLDILWSKGVRNLIFGFGDCSERLKLAKFVLEKGFTLATADSP